MAELIYGKNSVILALQAGRVKKIFVTHSSKDVRIISLAKAKNISLQYMENSKLTNLVKNHNHQGVVAQVSDYKYYSLTDLINDGKKVINPIIVMLDGIEDPHNLGAILRIVDAFNALGVVIKKTNQVPLNATVSKVSTGAINFVKVVEVSNLTNAINKLKEEKYWVVATDGDAKNSYTQIDYNMPVVLIIGSEGKGISRLVKEKSDYLVKIPMYGHVNSLNASNALSVILSNIINIRNSPKK